MIFAKPYSSVIIIAILLFVSAFSLLFDVDSREGFLEIVPLATDPSTKKIAKGYYQVDKDRMALLPYGFAVDKNDPTKILPVTKVGINMLKPRYNAPVPKSGEKMPDGFYLVCATATATTTATTTKPPSCSISDSSLAVLPPNMMPNLETIGFTDESRPEILYYYGLGYISETQYYEKLHTVPKKPETLPTELYYTDATQQYVSFLQYGQIMDPEKGFGAIKNPSLDLYTDKFSFQGSGYKDIQNDSSVQFHDDIDIIKKNNDLYDLSFGEVRVKDQYGNIIILPRTQSQGNVTYFDPGTYKFGGSIYVPNYEDSVYLSSVTNRSPFGQVKLANCNGACTAYTEFKSKMEKYCDAK